MWWAKILRNFLVGLPCFFRSEHLFYLQVYQACGLKDKERYKKEMQEYRERLKLLQPNEGMNERRQRRRLSAVSSCLPPDQSAVGTSATTALPLAVATVGTMDEKE